MERQPVSPCAVWGRHCHLEGGSPAMPAMFVACLLVIAGGLAYATAIGLMQR